MPSARLAQEGPEIRVGLRTRATPEQVWAAFADPRHLCGWFADDAEGELQPGGKVTWAFEKLGYAFQYEVMEAEPPRGFVLGWNVPGRPRQKLEATVTRDMGHTVLTLVQSGFVEHADWRDEYEGVRSGWRLALATLGQYVERHWGESRVNLFEMRPVTFDYDGLKPFFRSAEGLSRWLLRAGALGRVGDSVSWELRDGSLLDGEVLEVTEREALVRWHQLRGVLALKAFSVGQDRHIALQGTAWGLAPDRVAPVERFFGESLDRLIGTLGK